MTYKITISGSNGLIGRIIANELSTKDHELVLLDKDDADNPIDILTQDFASYLTGTDVVIHLAAHVSPFIGKELAHENIRMCERMIRACDADDSLKMIINASSVNVYPYYESYKQNEIITSATPLSPNLKFPGEYAKAKIECESLFNEYCRKRNVLLINLRLGHVNPRDTVPQSNENSPEDNEVERAIFLHHDDVRKIINSCLLLTESKPYACVSNKPRLFDESILFPL